MGPVLVRELQRKVVRNPAGPSDTASLRIIEDHRAKMWWNLGTRFPENFWEFPGGISEFVISQKMFKLLHLFIWSVVLFSELDPRVLHKRQWLLHANMRNINLIMLNVMLNCHSFTISSLLSSFLIRTKFNKYYLLISVIKLYVWYTSCYYSVLATSIWYCDFTR